MGDFEERLKAQGMQAPDNLSDSNAMTDPRTPAKISDPNAPVVDAPVEQPSYKSPKKNGLKQLVILAGVVIVILVIVSLVLNVGVFSSDKISEKQLIVGAALTMEENKSLKVEIGEEEHEIQVENVGDDWAEIVIRSDPIKFKLKVNEIIEIDLNSDGQSDIRVKLFKIQDGKAIIAVKRIDKEACQEEWSCGDWGGCISDKRERICTDANNCGSEFFIPRHEQRCVGSNPVDTPEDENIRPIRRINQSTIYYSLNETDDDGGNIRERIARMKFESSGCLANTEGPYQTDTDTNVNLRIKEHNWTNSTTLVVRAHVQHDCVSQVREGEHEILKDENKILLKYKVHRDPNILEECYCTYELIYRFTDLEEKDYEFELEPIFITNDNLVLSGNLCPTSHYQCNQSAGTFCREGRTIVNVDGSAITNDYPTYFVDSINHAICCPEPCVDFESEEQFCDSKDRPLFNENETHHCTNYSVHDRFNGMTMMCCNDIEKKNDVPGGTGELDYQSEHLRFIYQEDTVSVGDPFKIYYEILGEPADSQLLIYRYKKDRTRELWSHFSPYSYSDEYQIRAFTYNNFYVETDSFREPGTYVYEVERYSCSRLNTHLGISQCYFDSVENIPEILSNLEPDEAIYKEIVVIGEALPNECQTTYDCMDKPCDNCLEEHKRCLHNTQCVDCFGSWECKDGYACSDNVCVSENANAGT
jgi:hypothetical protein